MRYFATLAIVAICLIATPHAGVDDQTFALGPCQIGRGLQAECGRLLVPENRTTGQGRQIPINIIVLRATAQPSKDALFLLAGGPGQGSTLMLGMATGWLSPLRASMDVVLMDQRGTGGSGALACPVDFLADPASAFGRVTDPERMRQCRTALEQRADLTQYTTDAAVADIEALRMQLGYNRLAVFGASYGTRLAQAYVRRHPTRTKAVVLDGVMPFETVAPVTYTRSLQRSIDLVAAANPGLSADLTTLFDRLKKTPAKATVRPPGSAPVEVVMTHNDLAYAIRGIMYGANGAETLPGLVSRAATTGNLDAFAQRYWDRAHALNQQIAMGLHLSVFCAEDVPYPTEAEIEAAAAGTLMGRYLFDDYKRACAVWPRAPIAADFRTPVTARVPVLVVSGHFDPATPPSFGDQVARNLPLARHIVAPTAAHGAAAGCPRMAALHVLEKGTLDGLPEVCR